MEFVRNIRRDSYGCNDRSMLAAFPTCEARPVNGSHDSAYLVEGRNFAATMCG